MRMKSISGLVALFCMCAACRHTTPVESTQASTDADVTSAKPFIFSIALTDSSLVKIVHVQDEFKYDYDVDWDNDGTFDETNLTGEASHDYKEPGTYTIRIRGEFPHIYAQPSGLCGMNVLQWGDIQWKSMNSMFMKCREVSPTFSTKDSPDLSQVTDMSYMFANAWSFNQPINHWDVSHITNMDQMFAGARDFNQPLDQWDVSQVTNMQAMFTSTMYFNQPLQTWNVSRVTTMAAMFYGAERFNQPLGSWDVSQVTDMNYMFTGAYVFNQPLDTWNVSQVTDMSGMFSETMVFNQPLESWDVSHVTNMSFMFSATRAFNQPLGSWNTSNVTNMDVMFARAGAFNQPLNSWDTSSVTSMNSMFTEVRTFNQPLDQWDVSNVTAMKHMLDYCGMDTKNYDNTLIGWASQPTMPARHFGAEGITYCNAAAERQKLIDSGWVVKDEGLQCL